MENHQTYVTKGQKLINEKEVVELIQLHTEIKMSKLRNY